MATPPKGDPRRPLHLAIRSTRLLGIILLLLSSCAAFAVLAPRGRFGGRMLILFGVIGAYVTPGIAYLVFSIFLKERKLWAVIAAIITASINLLFVLLGGVAMAIAAFKRMGDGGADAAQMALAIVVVLWILALAQLIYHLALSFKAIQYIPLDGQRGFAPVIIQPAQPPMSNPTGDLPPV